MIRQGEVRERPAGIVAAKEVRGAGQFAIGRIGRALTLGAIGWVVVGWGIGGAWADPGGARDPALLERFPRAEIELYSEEETPEYRLALGSMEKVNGVVRPEAEESLRGRLTRVTYRIPDGHRSREVFAYLKAQLETQQPEWLFVCEGRDCGSSSQWANSQLGISKLYGLDREQGYFAARIQDTYLALYSTQRGTKRVYVQLDVLERTPAAPAAGLSDAAWAQALAAGEPLVLAAEQVGGDAARLAELAALINKSLDNPSRVQHRGEVWLVGHARGAGDTEQLREESLALAERLKRRLIEAGVGPERLFTFAVGPLAPSLDPLRPARRVEVIVR